MLYTNKDIDKEVKNLNTKINLNKTKKSQAAIEFLTTYAWAFILIIIVIAAISYFGVLRPRQILPDRCVFNVGFGCNAFQIDATADTFKLQLKNQVGQTIDVTAIALKREDEVAITCTVNPTPITNWKVGEVKDLTWTGCDDAPASSFTAAGFVKGDKGKVLVTMNYFIKPAGPTYGQSAEGEVLATVQ